MEENLLRQWRGYTAKNGGYNIGFNFDSDTKFSHNLENLLDVSHIVLRKVIYNLDKQNEIISKCISEIINGARKAIEYRPNHGGLPEAWEAQAASESANLLFDIIASLKNPAFKEEQEWRLIKIIDPSRIAEIIKFRNIKEKLVPYIITGIYKNVEGNYILPISKIRFGPMLDEINTKENLEIFIKNMVTIDSNIKIKAKDLQIESSGFILRE